MTIRLRRFWVTAILVPLVALSPAASALADTNTATTSGVNQNVTQSATTGSASVTTGQPADNTDSNTPPADDGTQPDNPPPTDNTNTGNPPADNNNSTPAPDPAPTPGCGQTQAASSNDSSAGASGSSTSTNTSSSTSATVNNNLCSNAQSGAATVSNTNGDANATTGSASAAATSLNLVNSTTGLNGSGSLATFNQDVNGNVNGNIYIDPSLLNYSLPSSSCTNNCSNGVSVNSNNSSTINNNITLTATSGNASTSDNTGSGASTTGSATTMLNLVNVINSLILSGQSFIGNINIYGNLNGNILLPTDFVNNLLASNAPNSDLVPSTSSGSQNISINSNASVNNNLTLSATSGDATVVNSGDNGTATSGNATTNLTSLNLVNQQITGQNNLMVFVNVLGQWTGLIYSAPAGTTTADLGGGISSSLTSCGSCNISVNSTTNDQINNNIYLSSVSGNATVGDSSSGISTTGNASASVNLANVVNSQLSLSNWFGLLFINVFGTWHGNLQAAPVVKSPDKNPPSSSGVPPSSQVFSLATSSGSSANYFTPASAPGPNDNNSQTPSVQPKVLGSTTAPALNGSPANVHNLNAVISSIIGGLLIFLGLLFGLGRRKKTEQ